MTRPSFDEATGRNRYFALMDSASARLIDPDTGKVRADAVELIPCPSCGHSGAFPIMFVKQGFDFVRCPACSLAFVNPQLKSEHIDSLYSEDDTFYKAWGEVLRNPANEEWQVPYFQDSIALLQRFGSSGKLLDIGCSTGLFLTLAEKNGFKGTGLELERAAFEHAKSRGLDVRRQTLEEASFEPGSHDAVTMFGVLEHVKNPKELLFQVHASLREGGMALAIVPNVESLAAMTLHTEARMFNGRNHLTYFSPRTLTSLFESAGFVVEHVDTVLTGLDSILSHWQYGMKRSPDDLVNLPTALRNVLTQPGGRQKVENFICQWDFGLRARVLARRMTAS